MDFRLITYKSLDYKKMVSLRNEVLRRPLGLHLTENCLADDKDSVLIGGFIQNELIACCLLKRLTEEVIQLKQMAVSPAMQGAQVGTRLISFAEQEARELGFLKLFMHARKTAIGFYEKLGYQIIGDEFEEISIPHFMMKKDLKI